MYKIYKNKISRQLNMALLYFGKKLIFQNLKKTSNVKEYIIFNITSN